MMASSSPQPGSSTGKTQEYVVRVPKDRQKRYKMMKYSTGTNIDFAKLFQEHVPVKMERENNLKEYKSAHDIDLMPKFGAGSEFGREQKDIARRKKYGIRMKNYDPNNQPWLMKVGKNKDAKKYKGVREGTISENTSYYIFTQCPDGAFEAFPIEEWYNFSPMVKYKYLNSEEAEEEFSRRDKTLNYFSIMVRNRIKNEEDGDNMKLEENEKQKEKTKKSKKEKNFLLTDMDDEDDDSYDDEEDDERKKDSDDEKPKNKSKKAAGAKQKRTAKHNSDDEAVEESDDGDFDDRELDYITDSDSSLSETGDREKGETYQEKGVDEERGLKKLLDSDESSEEEDENKKEDKDEAEKKEKTKKEGSDSDSSSSSSDSDSDIDKDEKISSAIFMQKKEKRRSPVPRADTPSSVDGDDKSSLKRKLDSEASVSKKMRTDSPSFGGQGSSSGGITEEAIRRYLMRKPMTAKELLQKFKSQRLNMTKEAMMKAIVTHLKKISPKKEMVKNVMYLSLKKEG